MNDILSGESASTLVVRTQGSDRNLPAGPSYLVGRDPQCDIVINDARVSSHHAALRAEGGHWVLADNGSTNGTYVGERRVDRLEINGECLIRLSDPTDGPVLSCTVSGTASSGPPALRPEPAPPTGMPGAVWPLAAETLRIGRGPDNDIVLSDLSVSTHHAELRNVAGALRIVDLGSTNGTFVNERRVTAAPLSEGDIVALGDSTFRLVGQELREYTGTQAYAEEAPLPVAASPDAGDGALDIPYAIRWLVPKGERFANFDILNDNDTQLEYYRRFGHIYAVGIPTKKWRLVVVSDPELLDDVAADEEQFGKRVEEINFFAQLSNSRGGGISVIGDGEHYERVRRVMLPWYAPSHQRTQLERMKEQARKLVAAWSAIPDDQPLDARAWMERYTLEVSGRGACSYDFGLLDGNDDPHPFAAAVPESTKESILRVAEPRPDVTVFAGRTRRRRTKRYHRNNDELFRTADALVHARMHTCPLGQQTDLLSRLVSTPDPETGELLDAETIRDQILMHLSNGFNGPSITGAWLAYVLATRPDVEEKLIAEIDGITGGDPRLRPAVRRLDGADVHDAGDQGGDANLPADADHDPPQPKGRNARPLSHPEGRHHPRRDARRTARPALLGPGPRQVRSGAVRDGEGRGAAAARLHPVLDRETAVHGPRGHVHDAPRRAVRDLPALPAAARAWCDGD